MKKKKPAVQEAKPPHPLVSLEDASEQSFGQSDTRVITRARDVLMFELHSLEEHLSGLRSSLVSVQANKARVEARLAGIRRVLARR